VAPLLIAALGGDNGTMGFASIVADDGGTAVAPCRSARGNGGGGGINTSGAPWLYSGLAPAAGAIGDADEKSAADR
jgi:hypothetical protein